MAVSPLYETEPHTLDPDEEQRAYLNGVVEAIVEGTPGELLTVAHAIEEAEGRTRTDRRWAPRPLDIDLLAVGTKTRATGTLTLPHPRLADRRFVLRPWADLAPDFVVPAPFDASVQELLARCPDAAEVRRADATLTVPPAHEGGPTLDR
jgi:2-amino-4-hydroxy-6-hydroxymethyldihydropteridine diphosphokinase